MKKRVRIPSSTLPSSAL